MTMTTSAAGLTAIRQREGCVLHAYQDSVGVWTIGVGHTGRASRPAVHAGMTITDAEADAMLAGDIAPFEAAVNDAIRRPMTHNQFDACVSLAFNIGAGGFAGSTVVHRFNAGDIAAAADAFLMWEKPAVLAKRRIAERAQFLAADAAGPDPIPPLSPVVPPPGRRPNIAGGPAPPPPSLWTRIKSLF